ncbi:MAG: site-specific integrase [Muribaculaceae bacterium]|nr:site-specific integrase [Muribaculaceae bacterium]
MATVKFYLDVRYKRSDGTSPVRLVLAHNNQRRFFALDMFIRPDDWDKSKSLMKPTAYRGKTLNTRLNKILAEINIELSLLQSDRLSKKIPFADMEDVVSMYLYGKPANGITVANRFIEFANRKRQSTKELYLFTLRRLRIYDRNFDQLTFDDIDRDWLLRFNDWMSKTSTSQNYRNIQLRNIRAVFNDAIASEITSNYPFRRITIRRERTKKRSLSVEQLRTLFDYDCEEYARQYVDIFKLMFLLCGINVVDLYNLERVENGRVTFNRSKTGRPYDIKVEPEAMAIIERYRGSSALLDLKDRYKDHRNYTHRINNNLKRIGPVTYGKRGKKESISPLFPELSTYWARHTWATIAAELDIPDKTISLALGHSEEQTVTDIYIRRNRRKVDDANRKVIDFVLYGIRDGEPSVNPWDSSYYGEYAEIMK